MILVRTEQGRLDGFWPFVERPGLLGSKGLWPFVYDEANYFDPISTDEAVGVLVEGLKSQLKGFLFCWIPLMRNSFWEKILEPETKRSSFLTLERSPRKTTFVDPSGDEPEFDSFLDKQLGAKSRKSLRYDRKKLMEQGNLSVETAMSFEEVRSIMPTTCMVEVRSWKSKEGAGLYSIRGKRGFFFELFPELARSGRVRISVMRLNEQPIAWQVDLLDDGYLGLHHLAFDQAFGKYSPGKQLLLENLKWAWEEGRLIDFLPGNFDYKDKLSTRSEPVRELHWFKKSFRGYLAVKLIKWNMRVQKKIRDKAKGVDSADHARKAQEG